MRHRHLPDNNDKTLLNNQREVADQQHPASRADKHMG
jgi:hypothetical protein